MGEDASRWHSSDHARVRLIRAGLAEDGRDLAGLVIELDNGWHTYWRSPGVFGLPPTFNWEGSDNVQDVEVLWPAPQHIIDRYYEAYGYEGRVVLPLLITRGNANAPAHLNLALGYAVCETVCIPAVGFVSMWLPETLAEVAVPDFRAQVVDALARVPTPDAGAAGIAMEPPRIERLPDGSEILRLAFTSESAFNNPHVIVEGAQGVTFGASVILLREQRRRLDATVPVDLEDETPSPLSRSATVTLTGGRRPVEFLIGPVVDE